jgi:membrane protein DedA with SNARE-associated domain
MLDFITHVYNLIQWPGVVVLMGLESACIPIPSEIIMPLAGWMLIRNLNLGPEYVFMAGALGALGCLIGSIAVYWLGKAEGRPLLEKYGKYILVTHHDLDMADRWFNKYGTLSIFISRLLPVVRTFISLPAGVAEMNYPKFLIYTFIGSFIWCTGLAYAGYVLGDHWEQISTAMEPATPAIVVIIVVLIALYVYRHIRHLRKP